MAEKLGGRIGCVSRVNGEMELDKGRLIWELLARPYQLYQEHASEVWRRRGKAAFINLEKIQENIGRKLVNGDITVAWW